LGALAPGILQSVAGVWSLSTQKVSTVVSRDRLVAARKHAAEHSHPSRHSKLVEAEPSKSGK